jgi:CHAD domain-containing protein
MKPTRFSLSLGKTFNKNVETVDAALKEFLSSGDPANTQAFRRAIRRASVSYSVLPKKLRKTSRAKRYAGTLAKLSKVTGKVRDYDTITAWASEVTEGKDWRAVASDLARLRATSLRDALSLARDLDHMKPPSIDLDDFDEASVERRLEKVEKRLVKRVDAEFEEFLSSQEIKVMHALRKDSKRLRHLLELSQEPGYDSLLRRLQSIQDDLGAIRDHDLEIDYLRSRVRLTSTRSLIREEIARRHAKLEEFMTKNRGRGRVVTVSAK